MNWVMHSSQCDALQNELKSKVNYLKKIQFSSLKWNDINQMTMLFEEKVEMLQEKFFSFSF